MQRWSLMTALAVVIGAAAPAVAQADDASAWTPQIVYKGDVIGAVSGADKHAGRYLDNLDVIVDGDLDKAVGWSGATVHAYLLNNSGGKPNALVDTLQGVDNIEVAHARTRLYELWIEQALAGGKASVRAGLYDLNSEFYSTDASHLLIAPPYGIGSEFSATGPNGPSIFPLTSLAVRLKVGGDDGLYAQAAAVSAHAGALSEPEHPHMGLDRGAILIGEAGVNGPRRLAFGAWTYTEKQDDLRDLDSSGTPVQRDAHGAYALGESEFWRAEERAAAAFFRLGVSDGRTTPFRGGWQAGVKVDGVIPGRPKSAASVGLQQGWLSHRQRQQGRDAGLDLGGAESGLEATIADTFGRLTVQPDLQLIRHPAGDRARGDALIVGVRLMIDLGPKTS